MTVQDPRMVPGRPVVPAVRVPPERLSAEALRYRFSLDIPWIADGPATEMEIGANGIPAAVLVGLATGSQPSVLLTQRTAHLRSHAGQIAFPGGRMDASDHDASATALREANEEVGLPLDQVEVLGLLPPHATGTGYVITPVIALIEPGVPLVPNPHEVADVFHGPLDFFMDARNHWLHEGMVGGRWRRWYSMPYRDSGHERYVWGATAAILRNLQQYLLAG